MADTLPQPDASAAAETTSARLVADSQRRAAREVLMLLNRKAGAGRGRDRVAQAEAAIAEAGCQPHRVERFEQLEPEARRLAASGDLRAVVAIGGDGTVGAVLNGTPAGTPIAVVPAGTENLLAKYLGCSREASDLSKLLQDGVVVRLDAGCANGRLFSLMISAGLDAEVVRQVHAERTGNITHLAYAKPILGSLRRYKYPPLRVRSTDEAGAEHQVEGRWVFGVNLPRYAQGLPIAAEANGADGLLDLRVFERGGVAAGLWYLWHVVRRRHHRLSSVTAERRREFRIESDAEDVAYQLDGDPGGVLPVDVAVEPGRLSLLVMPAVATRLNFALRTQPEIDDNP